MHAGIDLKRLQHFVLLSEELNFTRAADRAKLSQTAFSRSIQALEAGFDLALFDRGTRSVRLTAAGQQLLAKAHHLLALSRDLVRQVSDIASAHGGELSFGASLMAIDTVVGRALPKFMQQRPQLKVKVEASHWRSLHQQLEQERIEFFVGYPGQLRRNPDFLVMRLPSVVSSVFCRAEHPLLKKRRSPNPADLGRYPWASVQLRDRANVDMGKLFGVPADAPLPLALECNDLSLLRQTVLDSDTLLFTWNSWLQEEVMSDRLVDLGQLLKPAPEARAWNIECAVVQMSGRTLSPVAQQLIDLMKSKTQDRSMAE